MPNNRARVIEDNIVLRQQPVDEPRSRVGSIASYLVGIKPDNSLDARAMEYAFEEATEASAPAQKQLDELGVRRAGGLCIPFSTLMGPTPRESRRAAYGRKVLSQVGSATPMQRSGLATDEPTKGAAFDRTEAHPFYGHLFKDVNGFNRMRYVSCNSTTQRVAYSTSNASAVWRDENSGSDVSPTEMSIAAVNLRVKTLSSVVEYTKSLFYNIGERDLNALIRNDLASVFRAVLMEAAINGSDPNGPAGILGSTATTSYTLGANGAFISNDSLALGEKMSAEADLGDIEQTGAWLTNYAQSYRLQTIERASGSGYLLQNGRVLDRWPVSFTNRVPNNLTQGTATTITSPLIFGPWDTAVLGSWGDAMDIVVDEYTLGAQAKVRIAANIYADFGMIRPSAFTILRGAK